MDDILYVQIVNRKIEIRTETKLYTGSLSVQLDRLLTHFGMLKANQTKLVNPHKILSIDLEAGRVYFDPNKAISCQVSRRNKPKVLDIFDKIQHGKPTL